MKNRKEKSLRFGVTEKFLMHKIRFFSLWHILFLRFRVDTESTREITHEKLLQQYSCPI